MSIADGEKIVIKFTQALVGNVLGLNPPVASDVALSDLSEAVVTTLNQYSSSYPGSNVIDGNTGTRWRGTTSSNWLQVQLKEQKIIQKIRLYMGSYYISSFRFYGSNDASTWTQLGGTYTGASTDTSQWYTYTIDNAVAYLYYKIETLSGYSSSRIYLYELEFYEKIPAGNEKKFSISFDEYNFVPGGSLVKSARSPVSMEIVDENTIALYFDSGTANSFRRAVGDIVVSYDGKGSLMGMGGPVMAFDVSFTPESLLPKDNPHVSENINIADMSVSSSLISVFYTNTKKDEHISITSVVPECTLTHIDDV